MSPPKRLLVVDDEPLLIRIMEHLFSRSGYAVTTALNGQEALDRLGEQRFDLVLSDVMMPVMDGIAFVTALQKTPDPPPVVFLTGYGEHTDAELRALGAREVLGKPASPDALLAAIRTHAR
jgi:CheY-like chemotaxis protein